MVISNLLLYSCKGTSDADIQKAVNEKMASSTEMSGLSASVSNAVVTLTGQCTDESCKTSCASTVKSVKGVKDVVNNITVQPAAAPVTITADDPLKQGVDAALSNYSGVSADVNDGVVTLRGDIKRGDLQKLMVSLNALRPKKIENQLTVK
jgi:osmotically-inducible protein OsmY